MKDFPMNDDGTPKPCPLCGRQYCDHSLETRGDGVFQPPASVQEAEAIAAEVMAKGSATIEPVTPGSQAQAFERIITEVMRTVSEGYDVEIDEEVAKCVAVASWDLGKVDPPSEAPTWAQLRGRTRRHVEDEVLMVTIMDAGCLGWVLSSRNGVVSVWQRSDGELAVVVTSAWGNTLPQPDGRLNLGDTLRMVTLFLLEDMP